MMKNHYVDEEHHDVKKSNHRESDYPYKGETLVKLKRKCFLS